MKRKFDDVKRALYSDTDVDWEMNLIKRDYEIELTHPDTGKRIVVDLYSGLVSFRGYSDSDTSVSTVDEVVEAVNSVA